MKYLLGIDFGGGASKATLLCENGDICATATAEYPTDYPKPGYAEQDPSHWVEATCKNIAGVLDKSGVSPADIAAVSLDAATHTAVITDDDFNVIRPAIYWTDTRSTEEVKFLRENYGEIIEKQVLHKAATSISCANFSMPFVPANLICLTSILPPPWLPSVFLRTAP